MKRKNSKANPEAQKAVRCSSLLGRWWIGIRRTMTRGTDPVFRALLCKGWWRYCHDRMPRAFQAVWVWLETFWSPLPKHAHDLLESGWLRARLLCLEFCYRLRVIALHLRYLPIRVQQGRLYHKLVLLYLLDKRRCLSVLRQLNESSKQLADFGNGFKRGHNC